MNGSATDEQNLFVSTPKGESALVRLADHFFREVQAFGVLTSGSTVTDEMCGAYISTRGGFIKSFLETLTMFCDLRFATHSRIPFCYNRAEWPGGAPIEGYTPSEPEVLPADVATSLILNVQQRATGSLFSRLLTCAVRRLAGTGDLRDTVTYLFDLHQAGFAGADEVTETTCLLLRAHSQAGSCEVLVERCMRHAATGEIDWTTDVPDFEWVDESPLGKEGKAVLTLLFQRASRRVEEVRGAQDLDQWVLGQIHIDGLLTAVIRLFHELVENIPLPYQARLAQWEEIVCDAHALLMTSRAGFDALSAKARISSAHLMGQAIRQRVGTTWQDRLYQERLLVPAQLRAHYFSEPGEQFPPQWEHLSWRVIHPWLTAVAPGTAPSAVVRTSKTGQPSGESPGRGGERDIAEDLLADFETIHRLHEEHRYAEVEQHARSTLRRHPYMENLYAELAIALDHQNKPEAAREELLTGIFLNPHNPLLWHSLSVVLHRTGSHEEAAFAMAFSRFIASEARSADSGQRHEG
ncbi:hypothetical protein ACWGRF_26470 [Streptomyces zhihengii]